MFKNKKWKVVNNFFRIKYTLYHTKHIQNVKAVLSLKKKKIYYNNLVDCNPILFFHMTTVHFQVFFVTLHQLLQPLCLEDLRLNVEPVGNVVLEFLVVFKMLPSELFFVVLEEKVFDRC